jgi:Flp pilus assembly pilin Flp
MHGVNSNAAIASSVAMWVKQNISPPSAYACQTEAKAKAYWRSRVRFVSLPWPTDETHGFLPRERGGVYNLGELHGGAIMTDLLRKLWLQEEGQDIAEYAVMLAVILVLVVGTIRLIGGSANNVFSSTASSIGQ